MSWNPFLVVDQLLSKEVGCSQYIAYDKGQTSHWSSQTCSRISRLVVSHLVVTKPNQLLNCPMSDFFSWHPNTFCPDRPILTCYHQVPNTNSPYWHSATKYQPLLPFTDSIPPSSRDFCTVYPGSSWYNYELGKTFQEDSQPWRRSKAPAPPKSP